MSIEKENALAHRPLKTNEIMLGVDTDVSHLTLDERVEQFVRLSEAQASTVIDDHLLNKELVAVEMTVYQREFVDENGMPAIANYVHFALENGEEFRTAGSQALPFALQVARFIGYDPKTGKLPHPIKFMVQPQKADTGFIYRFVFKGLHK